MIIAHGDERKHITLYSSVQAPSLVSILERQEQKQTKSILSINEVFYLREEEENEDLLDLFILEPNISEQLRVAKYEAASNILNHYFQETYFGAKEMTAFSPKP